MIHLLDFAVRPKITPFGMPTKELAEAQWVIDFARQGEGYGKHRRDAGRTSVTVKLSDRTVTETNGKAGLAPDELAPLAYVIEKDGDGNVVIEAKTPEGRPTAKLEARVVIHSDGSSDFTRLYITPLVREPAQQEAPAQELVQAAPAA